MRLQIVKNYIKKFRRKQRDDNVAAQRLSSTKSKTLPRRHPRRIFMDNNRLYWIFVDSLNKTTKIIDYNRLKMDYHDTIFLCNIIRI